MTGIEIKAMVDLVTKDLDQLYLSPEKIQEKICIIWNKFVTLQEIYIALGNEFDEDFERESNKIKYYNSRIE